MERERPIVSSSRGLLFSSLANTRPDVSPTQSLLLTPRWFSFCYSLRAQELTFFLLVICLPPSEREICETPGPAAQFTED